MSHHAQFFDYLDALDGGTNWKNALIEYKNNPNEIAFKLNGFLRGYVPSNEYNDFLQRLVNGIRARNTSPFTVYRMTTVNEFSAPLVPNGHSDFPYLAFMSTGKTRENLHPFVQDTGTPLLLEIECPEGTSMALMEGGDFGLEDEYLLGCRTRFSIIGVNHIENSGNFEVVQWGAPHKKMYKARLRIVGNPSYTRERAAFEFDPNDA